MSIKLKIKLNKNIKKIVTALDSNIAKTIYCCIGIVISLIFLISHIYMILLNETEYKAYEEYSTSSDIRKVEIEVIDIKEGIGKRNKNNLGIIYNYYVKFIVNNVEYKEKFSNPEKIMEIGDKTTKEVYKDKKGNYKFPNTSFKTKEEKDNENKSLIIGAIFIGIVTCFFIFLLPMMLHSLKTKKGEKTVTKNNNIYEQFITYLIIFLTCGFFIAFGILTILESNKEYDNYFKNLQIENRNYKESKNSYQNLIKQKPEIEAKIKVAKKNKNTNIILSIIFFIAFPGLLGTTLIIGCFYHYNPQKNTKLKDKTISLKKENEDKTE